MSTDEQTRLEPMAKLQRDYLRAQLNYHRARERAETSLLRALAVLLEEDVSEAPVPKGEIQRRIVRLSELGTETGITAGEVAKRLSYDEANVYTVLSSLEKAEVLETVPGAAPRRWRLTLKHRRDRILRLSRLIPEGTWTTYGDFAIAVYDNWRMAVTIGRVASKSPAFANPQRVLMSGGKVHEEWKDDEGNGPEECVRRLGEEGVPFIDDRADPERFIGWEQLKALLEADEAREGQDGAAV